MQLSSYTHAWPAPGISGTLLAFNTLTYATALIPRAFLGSVASARSVEELRPDRRAIAEQLLGNGLLVREVSEDIVRLRWYMRTQLKHGSGLAVTVCPTLDCNCACTYCYQEDLASQRPMTRDTADCVIAWVKRAAIARKAEEIKLGFYGGEPLLEPETVLHIGQELRDFCRRHDLRFQPHVVTNGVLLAQPLVSSLRDAFGVHTLSCQVTLDGPPPVHNRRRPFREEQSGGFAQIERNLAANSGELDLALRVTVDETNEESIPELLAYLVDSGLVGDPSGEGQGRVKVYLAPTRPCGRSCDAHAFALHEFMDAAVRLWEIGAERGLDLCDLQRMTPCMEFHGNGICIGPDGVLYSCQGFIGMPDMAVGHVAEDKLYVSYVEHLCLEPWRECPETCTYFPICVGGCRETALHKYGDWRARVCDPDGLKAAVEAYATFKFASQIQALGRDSIPETGR